VYRLLRPLLFLLPPEAAHAAASAPLWAWSRLARKSPPRERMAQTLWGLRFPNPIGLAAGMDKGQVLVPAWFRLGFGFVEVGTVTPRPQPGNPRPRLFRLPEHRAIVNRMGFNNPGAARVARRLSRLPRQPGPVGVNVGRNKDTPNERAAADYVAAFRALAPYADYAAINVSSPNTPGLRELQAADELRALVEQVAGARDELAKAVTLNPNLPGAHVLDDAIGQMKAILRGSDDNTIATFNASHRSIKDSIKRAVELEQALSAPRLHDLDRAREALRTAWPFLRNELDVSDDLRSKAATLEVRSKAAQIGAAFDLRIRPTIEKFDVPPSQCRKA